MTEEEMREMLKEAIDDWFDTLPIPSFALPEEQEILQLVGNLMFLLRGYK